VNELITQEPPREACLAPAPAADPMSLLQLAISRGISPDELGKLMDLQERWENRRAAEAFARAIAGFQAECPAVLKTRTAKVKTSGGGDYTYRFESFDDVMRAAGPVLAKWGIVVDFSTEQAENPPRLKILVRLRVGAYFEDKTFSCPIPSDVKVSEPQKFGQALSYAKRYAIKAALNIVSTDQEDNDAQGLFAYVTGEQAAEIDRLIKETGADRERFLKWAECDSVGELPAASYAKALDMLRRKKKGGAS
jgi:hypothetical protein